MVFKGFAADPNGHIPFHRLSGEQHGITVEIVTLVHFPELDRRTFDHAERVKDRDPGRKLDVLVPVLETRDGRRADLGDGGEPLLGKP